MKSKIITIAFVLVAAISITNAQQRVRGGSAFVKLGYTGAPRSATTFTKIAPAGISGFTNNYVAIGAEGYFRIGKAILGLEGNVGAQGVYSSGDDYAEPFVGAAHLRFGWVMTGDERYWVYPTLGLGTAAMVLTTYNKVDPDNESENVSNMILLSPSLDLGINADFVVNKVNKERRMYGGFILGIRAGYRISYSSDDWKNDEWEDLDLPTYQNNAFYVTVSIGGGWFVKKEVKP